MYWVPGYQERWENAISFRLKQFSLISKFSLTKKNNFKIKVKWTFKKKQRKIGLKAVVVFVGQSNICFKFMFCFLFYYIFGQNNICFNYVKIYIASK